MTLNFDHTSNRIYTTIGSNGNIVLSPDGNGAILGQKPDNTATGGNARGVKAIDLQLSRSNANQVASGDYCIQLGGQDNLTSGYQSITGGGYSNENGGIQSFLGSGTQNSIATNNIASVLNGGSTNVLDADYAVISGGAYNTIGGNYSIGEGYSSNDFNVIGRKVFSTFGITSTDGCQVSEMQLYRQSENATPINLTSNGVTATSLNQYLSQDYQVTTLTFMINAWDGGDRKTWKGFASLSSVSGVLTIDAQNFDLIYESAGASAWDVEIVVSSLNACFQATGETAKTIRWSCHLIANELIYNVG